MPPAGVIEPAWTKPKKAAIAPTDGPPHGAAELAVDQMGAHRRPHHAGDHEALREGDEAVEVQAALRERGGLGEDARREPAVAADDAGGAERLRQHQQTPGGDRGEQPDRHGRRVLGRRRLKRLRRDDDADPQHDRHARFHRHQRIDQVGEAAERDDREEDAVQHRVAGARAELPSSPDGRCRSWSGSTSRTPRRRSSRAPLTASDGSVG